MRPELGRVRRTAVAPFRWLRGLLPGLRDAPVILMYHRVAAPRCDPWGLSVTPEQFRDQLRALRESRAILSLDDLVAGLEAGSLPPRATALTFDDGYADNVLVAKPMLEELQIKATFFVATGPIVSSGPFWWDELARLVLTSSQEADFEVSLAGEGYAFAWPAQPQPPADLAGWRFGQSTSDPRRLAFARLWSSLQRLPEAERTAAIETLRDRIGEVERSAGDLDARPMTQDMLRAATSPFVSLGAHGRSHVPLVTLPPPARRDELLLARNELAALAGVPPPTGLAYPHGSHDAATRQMAVEAGYQWAVTTRPARINRTRFDRFALPRLTVGRWTGREMLRALNAAGY